MPQSQVKALPPSSVQELLPAGLQGVPLHGQSAQTPSQSDTLLSNSGMEVWANVSEHVATAEQEPPLGPPSRVAPPVQTKSLLPMASSHVPTEVASKLANGYAAKAEMPVSGAMPSAW